MSAQCLEAWGSHPVRLSLGSSSKITSVTLAGGALWKVKTCDPWPSRRRIWKLDPWPQPALFLGLPPSKDWIELDSTGRRCGHHKDGTETKPKKTSLWHHTPLQKACGWWPQPRNSKTLAPREKSDDQPRQHIKKQRHYFANKGPSSQGYGFSSGHVWMWELDYKERWALKNWCFWEKQKTSFEKSWSVGEDSWESLGLQGDPTSPS